MRRRLPRPWPPIHLWLVLLASILGLPSSGLAQAPAPAADEFCRSALDAMNVGDDGKALRLMQEAILEDPANLEYQRALGRIYFKLGRLDEAETIFLALLREDEARFREVYFDLAALSLTRGREIEAVERLRKAWVADPGRADYETGRVYMRLKQYEEAIRFFKAAAAEKPELAAESSIQHAVASSALKRYAEARSLLESVLKTVLPPQKAEEVRRLIQSVEEATKAARPWRLSLSTGFQYDSNVLQNPLQTVSLTRRTVTNEEDMAFLLTATARMDLYKKEAWTAGAAYHHVQLNYFDLTEESLIGLRPSVYVQWTNPLMLAQMEYLFSHYFIGGDSNADVHSLLPRVLLRHGSRWMSDLSAGVERLEFHDATPDDRLYRVGLTEYLLLRGGQAHLRAGVLFQVDDLSPDQRGDFLTQEILLGCQFPVWRNRWFLDICGGGPLAQLRLRPVYQYKAGTGGYRAERHSSALWADHLLGFPQSDISTHLERLEHRRPRVRSVPL